MLEKVFKSMIISDKYCYIFIGLPFSASTAISKHLSEKYEGKPLLRKHSVYFEAKSQLSTKQKNYFVFALLLEIQWKLLLLLMRS